MSDEERNDSIIPDETPAAPERPDALRWDGPEQGKWPEVLRGYERREPQPGEFASRAADLTGAEPEKAQPETEAAQDAPYVVMPGEENTREAERAYRPIRFRRDGRLGCMGGLMYAVFIICVSVVCAGFAWMAASDVLALNKPANTVEITLPETLFTEQQVEVKDDDGNVTGTRMARVADIKGVAGLLRDYGIINYEWLFKLYSSFSHADRQIDPGTYVLSTSYDYRALVKKMQVGSDSQLQTLVTFPEGFTMEQIFTRLEENGICSKPDLYEAAAEAEYSYSFLEGVGPGDANRLEGFLFPDTYYFYNGMEASSAINKFLSTLHYKITAEMWDQAAAQNMTFRQIMTIASIIEKESANDDAERKLIASVIYNRLAAGMPLQIDATVLYALQGQDVTLTPALIQATDSPYNTYLYTGLPPGPISNPGMASLTAALQPSTSNYMFYALDMETQKHRFFIHQEEHEAFVATQDYSAATPTE